MVPVDPTVSGCSLMGRDIVGRELLSRGWMVIDLESGAGCQGRRRHPGHAVPAGISLVVAGLPVRRSRDARRSADARLRTCPAAAVRVRHLSEGAVSGIPESDR